MVSFPPTSLTSSLLLTVLDRALTLVRFVYGYNLVLLVTFFICYGTPSLSLLLRLLTLYAREERVGIGLLRLF